MAFGRRPAASRPSAPKRWEAPREPRILGCPARPAPPSTRPPRILLSLKPFHDVSTLAPRRPSRRGPDPPVGPGQRRAGADRAEREFPRQPALRPGSLRRLGLDQSRRRQGIRPRGPDQRLLHRGRVEPHRPDRSAIRFRRVHHLAGRQDLGQLRLRDQRRRRRPARRGPFRSPGQHHHLFLDGRHRLLHRPQHLHGRERRGLPLRLQRLAGHGVHRLRRQPGQPAGGGQLHGPLRA
jgi:hypothetical protein